MRQMNVCFCWGILGGGWSIGQMKIQVVGDVLTVLRTIFFPTFSLFFSIQNQMTLFLHDKMLITMYQSII